MVEIDGGRHYLYIVWWLLHEVNKAILFIIKLSYDKIIWLENIEGISLVSLLLKIFNKI